MASIFRKLVVALATLFVALAVRAKAEPIARFVPLGDLPGGSFRSEAISISADGLTIAGTGTEEVPPMSAGFGLEAVRWSLPIGPQGLGSELGARGTSAIAISGNGSVIVGMIHEEVPNRSAFIWDAANGMKKLSGCTCLGFSDATAVSFDGSVVVGQMRTSNGPRAYRWTSESGAQDLGELPGGNSGSDATSVSADGSVVVGSSGATNGEFAFRWTAGEGIKSLGNFLQTGESRALGISSDGNAIVGYGSHLLGQEAAIWRTDGPNLSMLGLGDLAGGNHISYAHDLSDDGSIVVGASISDRGFEAFRWTEQSGMLSVQSILSRLGVDTSGYWIQYAHAVSADGSTIVGTAVNPDGNPEAFVATIPPFYVPEPSIFSASAVLAIFALYCRVFKSSVSLTRPATPSKSCRAS